MKASALPGALPETQVTALGPEANGADPGKTNGDGPASTLKPSDILRIDSNGRNTAKESAGTRQDDKSPDAATAEDCTALIARVFAYDEVEGAGTAIARSKTRRFSFSAYGPDNSDNEPNPLKRMLWRIYHWRWRKEVFRTMSFPETSRLAVAISVVVFATVLLSSTTFVLSTVDDLNTPMNKKIFDEVEIFSISVFTADYGLRLLTCPNVWTFVRSPMNIIDLIAIVPYFAFLGAGDTAQGGASRIVRILSLMRILRLLKLGNRFQNLQVVIEAFVASLDMLGMLVFLLLLLLVLCSSILYFTEMGVEGTQFDSIPASMWWCQVTLLTVGYGDMVPTTNWGKLCAGLTMLVAIIVIALPISVLGANFTQLWIEYKAAKQAEARMAQVWPNFKELATSLSTHELLVSDIMASIKEQQAEVEAQVIAMRDGVQAARRQLAKLSQAPSATPAFVEGVAELQTVCAQQRSVLSDARRRWLDLKASMGVLASTQTDELLSKLETTHLAYKNLHKWYDEGGYILKEVAALREDYGKLKERMAAGSPALAAAMAAAADVGDKGHHAAKA